MATTHKLTDTHLVILGAAARHARAIALPLPAGTDERIGARALKQLLRWGLIAEVPAAADDCEWRREEDGSRLTLATSEAGLSAIGITESGTATEACGAPVIIHAPARNGEGDRRSKVPANGAANLPSPARDEGSGEAIAPSLTDKKGAAFTPGTKAAIILKLLRRKRGANIADLMDATGWQAHSVRGFLSGTLKKKYGLTIIGEKDDGGERRYRTAL